MPTRIARFVIMATCALPLAAHAWGHKGHQVVGAIADRQLNKAAAQHVRELLGMPLRDAAGWADCVKDVTMVGGIPEYKPMQQYAAACRIFETKSGIADMKDFVARNTGNCTTNAGAEVCHKQYHYTDVNITQPAYAELVGTSKNDIVHAIAAAIDVLQGRPSPAPFSIKSQREALFLLTHLVGDVHQPLHAAAIYLDQQGRPIDPDALDPFDHQTETRGGNSLTLGSSNLHSYWDTIPEGLSPDQLPASMLQEATQTPQADGPLTTCSTAWATDTIRQAGAAYDNVRFGPRGDKGKWVATLTDRGSYDTRKQALQRGQLAKAGGRLAQLLNEIWQ